MSLPALLPALTKQDRGPPVGSVQKRKLRAEACDICRTHKRKCDGQRPKCGACVKRNSDCQYTESKARSVSRKYDDLRNTRSTHEELLTLMKTLPEQDAASLFRSIRAGGDFGAILSHFRDGDLLLQLRLAPETQMKYDLPYSRHMPEILLSSGSPYLDTVMFEPNSQHAASNVATSQDNAPYVKPYHAATLVEPRLDNAKPSVWTNVSQDDSLLREILTAYFMHEYHLFPVFQKDYFFEDMAATEPDKPAQFCSALLVNAVLAYGSCCYKRIANRFRYWEPDALGYRFLAEAKRLWELDNADSSNMHRRLTSVQAAFIINIVLNLHGLDKIGDIYGRQGLSIAEDIGLFDAEEHITSERTRHARNFTAWCLHDNDVHLNWHFLRPPWLTRPPQSALPDPVTHSAWYGEIWTRYASSPTLSQTHFPEFFKAKSDYTCILSELGRASFRKDSTLSIRQAANFTHRLLDFFQALPKALTHKYIVLPAHYLLHLDYYVVLMTICQPFVRDEETEGINFQKIVHDSQRDINILLRLYYIRHGFSHADSWLTNPLAKLVFLSLQMISDNPSAQELSYLQSSLILALKGLREQGRNYYISRTVYYIARNQLRPQDAALLLGTEDPELAVDQSPGLVGEIQSAWTPIYPNISNNLVAKDLSQLAKEFLTIESNGPAIDGSGYDSTAPA